MTPAQAQYGPRDRDRDSDRPGWSFNDRGYQEGYQRGRFDAERNRPYRVQFRGWMDARDRNAFEAGYNRAYRDYQRPGLQFRFRFGR